MKSPEMNEVIKLLTGMDVNQAITDKVCPCCDKPVGEFRDELSQKEFEISGLCQECQDSIWGSVGQDEGDEQEE